MTNLTDKINKYLAEVLLFGDYKDKTEVIDNLISDIKIIIGVCLSEIIYYFYSIFKTGHGDSLNIVICFTICIISTFRILYLLHILKKL